MKLPVELKPAQLTVVIDTREQLPWSFPMSTTTGTLEAGDYSISGCENLIAVERKSLDDLVGCCGRERERFQRELNRLRGYQSKAVIVEAGWRDLEAGEWRSQVSSKSVVASVLSWMTDGIPFILAGDRKQAEVYAARFLFLAARKRYRELRGFLSEFSEKKTKTSPNAIKPETLSSFYVTD